MFINRDLFIEKFKTSFCTNSVIFSFNIFVENYSDENEFNLKLKKKFGVFFEQNGVCEDVFDNIPIEKNYDHYYDEEHPDSKYCKFNCEINLHILYDYIKNISGTVSDIFDIYRLESKNGNGLYSTGFASKSVGDKNPGPLEDENFKGIFCEKTSGRDFSRKWFFGFRTLDDMRSWIGDSHNLIQNSTVVKKYSIEKDYLIHGNKQSIFKKQHAVKCEDINWDEVFFSEINFKM